MDKTQTEQQQAIILPSSFEQKDKREIREEIPLRLWIHLLLRILVLVLMLILFMLLPLLILLLEQEQVAHSLCLRVAKVLRASDLNSIALEFPLT